MTKDLNNHPYETFSGKYFQRCLELMCVFQTSNFKILEGIIDPDQSTFLFEEAAPEDEDCRWGIKMLVQGNYMKLETEKKPKRTNETLL